eukprot:TRINITY_DN23997_c0_g1_i1.p1 TRINITY_DN23997_c0_g1~~TRINITY_DN23997_c0_g1_i1.p1  ORF type:complete len:432 (+),score=112.48 TRINITY_DN23997_c0_g1_i1:208-1503(+)
MMLPRLRLWVTLALTAAVCIASAGAVRLSEANDPAAGGDDSLATLLRAAAVAHDVVTAEEDRNVRKLDELSNAKLTALPLAPPPLTDALAQKAAAPAATTSTTTAGPARKATTTPAQSPMAKKTVGKPTEPKSASGSTAASPAAAAAGKENPGSQSPAAAKTTTTTAPATPPAAGGGGEGGGQMPGSSPTGAAADGLDLQSIVARFNQPAADQQNSTNSSAAMNASGNNTQPLGIVLLQTTTAEPLDATIARLLLAGGKNRPDVQLVAETASEAQTAGVRQPGNCEAGWELIWFSEELWESEYVPHWLLKDIKLRNQTHRRWDEPVEDCTIAVVRGVREASTGHGAALAVLDREFAEAGLRRAYVLLGEEETGCAHAAEFYRSAPAVFRNYWTEDCLQFPNILEVPLGLAKVCPRTERAQPNGGGFQEVVA